MIIRMRKNAHLGIVGAAVMKLVDEGCDQNDILIRRDNGETVIAVFGLSETLLNSKFKDCLFKERIVWMESCDPDNALFCQSNGEGFEEAWSVLQSVKGRQ